MTGSGVHPPTIGPFGFTLAEVATVLAISAVLAMAAWPSWRAQLLRSRRVEATTSLQQLQRAQAGYFTRFGRYAGRLDQLPDGPRELSDGSHYRLTLRSDGTEGYRALAAAQAGQADDRDCAAIELRVRGAISEQLPSARCWLP